MEHNTFPALAELGGSGLGHLVQALFEHAPYGVLIFNEAGEILQANPETKELLGYAPPPNARVLLPTIPPTIAELERWFGVREIEVHRADGSTFLAEVSLSPLALQEHKLFLAFIKESNRKTQEELKLVRATMDASQANIAVLDKRGYIIATSKRWETFLLENDGVPERASIGVNYVEVCRVANDPIASQAGRMLQEILDGQRQSGDLDYPCDSPSEKRWFWMHATELSGGGVVVVHTNITDRILN